VYGVEEVLILHVVTRNLTVQRFVRTFTHVNNEIEVHQSGAGHSMQNRTLRELEGKRQVRNYLNVNYVTRDEKKQRKERGAAWTDLDMFLGRLS